MPESGGVLFDAVMLLCDGCRDAHDKAEVHLERIAVKLKRVSMRGNPDTFVYVCAHLLGRVVHDAETNNVRPGRALAALLRDLEVDGE